MTVPQSPGPSPSVSDADIITAIVSDRKPALATTDIADKIGLSRQATGKHLERMEGDGYVQSGKFGPATGWWPTDAGRALLAQSPDGQ